MKFLIKIDALMVSLTQDLNCREDFSNFAGTLIKLNSPGHIFFGQRSNQNAGMLQRHNYAVPDNQQHCHKYAKSRNTCNHHK